MKKSTITEPLKGGGRSPSRRQADTAASLTETSLRVVQRRGRRMAIRLENIYWDQLLDLAQTDGITLNELIFRIVGDLDKSTNRTSALRAFCLHRLRQEMALSAMKSGSIDLAAIITACPLPVMVLTPERKIAAYNPAFATGILAPSRRGDDDEGKSSLRLIFNQPFNQIIRQVHENPRKIIAGQIGFSTADAHTQRRVRYAMADRSQGEKSHLIVFVEMPVEVREANGTKGSA
jgi:predicted DNA-binding ribbon-helix-helix protein